MSFVLIAIIKLLHNILICFNTYSFQHQRFNIEKNVYHPHRARFLDFSCASLNEQNVILMEHYVAQNTDYS